MAIPLMYFVKDPWAAGPPASLSLRARHGELAEAAYFLSQARGFAPGRELDDWLAAEREIDAGKGDEAHRRHAAG